MLENQGLLAIAFFEATAYVVLLALFALLKRDHNSSYFHHWLTGWLALTGSAISKLFFLSWSYQPQTPSSTLLEKPTEASYNIGKTCVLTHIPQFQPEGL